MHSLLFDNKALSVRLIYASKLDGKILILYVIIFVTGCVTISPDGGLWNDDNCGRTFGYVCEKIIGSTGGQVDPTPQATGNCPTGDDFLLVDTSSCNVNRQRLLMSFYIYGNHHIGFSPYGNNCYITGGEKTYTWETAREWCKNNSAELVVIGNEYEQVRTLVVCYYGI